MWFDPYLAHKHHFFFLSTIKKIGKIAIQLKKQNQKCTKNLLKAKPRALGSRDNEVPYHTCQSSFFLPFFSKQTLLYGTYFEESKQAAATHARCIVQPVVSRGTPRKEPMGDTYLAFDTVKPQSPLVGPGFKNSPIYEKATRVLRLRN